MPGGGVWSTGSLPTRAGPYFDFVAALQQALTTGVVGTAAVIGTADWGPLGVAETVNGLGPYQSIYSSSTNGTLSEGVLGALDGFDGGGAGQALAYRIAGESAKAGSVELKGTVEAEEKVTLVLTALYKGARANNFTITIQTNANNAENKNLILYESGVELERWENVVKGYNGNFVTAINTTAPSKYIKAEAKEGNERAMKNIVGVISGAGGFSGGNSGLTVTTENFSTALGVLSSQEFDSIALANVTTAKTLDTFVAWLRDRNAQGIRTFGVIGGKEGDTLSEAHGRLIASEAPPKEGTGYSDGKETNGQYTYGKVAIDLVNLGATDLRRLADKAVLSTAQLATRYAGTLARVGFTRAMLGITWTGYQVNDPLTPSAYTEAGEDGVVCFANNDTQTISIDNSQSALLTTDEKERLAAFKDTRTVAITHFIENTLSRTARNSYIGVLANNQTSRNEVIGSFLQFLKDLEIANALQPGTSTVELDDSFVQGSDELFLRYGIQPLGVIKRIFSTVRVQS